jgi:hypothetical protein
MYPRAQEISTTKLLWIENDVFAGWLVLTALGFFNRLVESKVLLLRS